MDNQRTKKRFFKKPQLAALFICTLFTAFIVGRIHICLKTTLTGYEIGKLKAQEAELLEKRSYLKMQHAKLTTKRSLQLMTDVDTGKTDSKRRYASR
jgi:hypothetical protein